jgi:hypothetical protein
MTDTYVEHARQELHGFELSDVTVADDRDNHDDLVWIAYGGEGRWLMPHEALALAKAIAELATGNLVRRGLAEPGDSP